MPISGSDVALMYALSAVARSGATRSGHHKGLVYLSIGGTERRTNVMFGSLVITDLVDETPNRLEMTVQGIVPTKAQEVIVRLGSSNNRERIFGGHILQIRQAQRQSGSPVFYHVAAVDYTWLLGKRLVRKRYTNQTATAIAQDLISSYATGFTSKGVASGLITIDEITFTDEELPAALSRLAKRIGGYWYVDYLKDVHLFITETGNGTPVTLSTTHTSFADFGYDVDIGQVVTRVYVEGGGAACLVDRVAGDLTIPVATSAWYNASGGTIVSGPQRITYTGLIAGGAGSLVGPGVTPSSGPTATLAIGAGIDDGAHYYAFTWVTAAGETKPSPASATITHGAVAAPTVAPTNEGLSGDSEGTTNIAIGTTYEYVYTYGLHATFNNTSQDTAESAAVAIAAVVAAGLGAPYAQYPTLRVTHSSNAAVQWIHIWRRVTGVGTYKYLKHAINVTHSLSVYEASGADLPAANGTQRQTSLSGIAVGPSGTTDRKVYRVAAGGSQLKLLTTIANNTATTYTDSSADSALGANVPTSDTSGLTQPNGTILAGDTSIIVSNAGPFSSTGGWAIIGNGAHVISYTGKSATAITGIPATGTGAIVAPVSYNSTISVAPMLTGVPATGTTGAILYPITKGDDVNLLVQRDNTGGQGALGTLIGGGDDGIVEETIQDRRLSEEEAIARGDALLALRGASEASIRYACRDKRTSSGKSITVSLAGDTNVNATFKIQQVRISQFSVSATVMPTYTVEASTTRFSFEDLLRMARREPRAS